MNSFITCNSNVLEIGCTNGFSSIEMNKLTNCNVIGIDINKNSIQNAREKILLNHLNEEKVSFEYGNAEDLSNFDDDSFDLIICGNAISFISDKGKALKEMIRVLKPNGFISIVPIWYKYIPREDVINKVNKELGFNIKCYYENDWLDFSKYGLELYLKKDFEFIYSTKEQIENYVNYMIDSKEHLKIYSEKDINLMKKRWQRIIEVFNENLSFTNYSVILLRKSLIEEEPEIFYTKEVKN